MHFSLINRPVSKSLTLILQGIKRTRNNMWWSRREMLSGRRALILLENGAFSYANDSWWRHDMETLSELLASCEGNPRWIPSQAMRNFDVFVVEQTGELSIIWDVVTLMLRRCFVFCCWTNNWIVGDLGRLNVHVTSLLCLSYVSMAECKTVISPVLMHWRYHSLALSHRCYLCKHNSGSTNKHFSPIAPVEITDYKRRDVTHACRLISHNLMMPKWRRDRKE